MPFSLFFDLYDHLRDTWSRKIQPDEEKSLSRKIRDLTHLAKECLIFTDLRSTGLICYGMSLVCICKR